MVRLVILRLMRLIDSQPRTRRMSWLGHWEVVLALVLVFVFILVVVLVLVWGLMPISVLVLVEVAVVEGWFDQGSPPHPGVVLHIVPWSECWHWDSEK